MAHLPVLDALLAELKGEPGVLAVFLTGSYTRGEADAFSDLDVSVLVEADAFVRTDVTYRKGVLVSVDRTTVPRRERAFTDPETALWNLGSLRSGQALHDPAGVFAALQERARAFVWAEVEPQAHARAAALLAGSVEALHKVMGGLQAGDADKLAFALVGLTFALGNAALLGTGTLIPTENRYLSAARGAWADPVWRDAYACLTGVTGEDIAQRGRAALRAYARAVALTRWTDGPDHAQAQEAAHRAAAFLRG